MEIRDAVHSDIPALVNIGIAMHRESRFRIYNFSADKLSNRLGYIIDHQNGIAFVAVEGGLIIGVFIGMVSTHYFGDSKTSEDKIIYVKPEYRKGKIGALLIKYYIEVAKSLNVEDICIGNSSGIETEKVWKLYERLGFELNGAEFSYKE